ncbi:MAG TPA: Crp/Fnr family transcriptional regulator [Lachnospiraceae bacterium]|nr:Crp/Fnr family transcriptional regulator [Lachnospiraceae bacterium]
MEMCNCPLFYGIDHNNCIEMLSCFESSTKNFALGETICNYSHSNNKIGILQYGSANMIRIDHDGNRTILETLEKNSVFGEALAFSGNSEDSLFVECKKPCGVIFLDYDHITKMCENACMHHTLLLQNMFRLIAEKLLVMSNRVEVLSHRTIRGKLMCYFNITSATQKSLSFQLPFSVSALADYICTDRSAMMRELKNMKNENIIEMDKRNVSLKKTPLKN